LVLQLGHWISEPGFDVWQGQEVFLFKTSKLILGPLNLQFIGYKGSFPQVKWLKHYLGQSSQRRANDN
jgi:hypothetical protein